MASRKAFVGRGTRGVFWEGPELSVLTSYLRSKMVFFVSKCSFYRESLDYQSYFPYAQVWPWTAEVGVYGRNRGGFGQKGQKIGAARHRSAPHSILDSPF